MVNELKLNLACGSNKVEGYFGIDVVKTDITDAVMDLLEFPWDIESDSAEDVICSHFIEHTPLDLYSKRLIKLLNESSSFEEYKSKVNSIDVGFTGDGLIMFMDELYRILKPGGKAKIIAPYYSSIRCWQDPTHRRAISDATFLYFNKGWRDTNKLDHYGIKSDFDFSYGYDINGEWTTRQDDARNFGILHYINTINDIHCVLTKRVVEEPKV